MPDPVARKSACKPQAFASAVTLLCVIDIMQCQVAMELQRTSLNFSCQLTTEGSSLLHMVPRALICVHLVRQLQGG